MELMKILVGVVIIGFFCYVMRRACRNAETDGVFEETKYKFFTFFFGFLYFCSVAAVIFIILGTILDFFI